MNLKLVLIFISLSGCYCSAPKYNLHLGEFFYPPERMTGGSLIAETPVDSLLEVTGIYCDSNVFIDRYPVIRIYNQGKFYIPLSTKLQVPDGMLTKVKGKVIQLSITYSMIKRTLSYNYLEPIAFKFVYDTKKLVKDVTDEYHRIRQKLQQQITLEQSKLQLTADPAWAIWYDGRQKMFIFHSHQYDLMYAADIEFIVDARTAKIKDVFAKEWFKGEM